MNEAGPSRVGDLCLPLYLLYCIPEKTTQILRFNQPSSVIAI